MQISIEMPEDGVTEGIYDVKILLVDSGVDKLVTLEGFRVYDGLAPKILATVSQPNVFERLADTDQKMCVVGRELSFGPIRTHLKCLTVHSLRLDFGQRRPTCHSARVELAPPLALSHLSSDPCRGFFDRAK